MTELERPKSIRELLDDSRLEAPSEVVVAADGSQHVIQWEGTPAPSQWVTTFLDGLVVARLIEPFPEVPAGLSKDERAIAEKRLDDRTREWHKPLAGLPMETLTAAGEHFRRHGVPDGRWGYLKPSDLSRWIRPRLRRRIPLGKECEAHPSEWRHSCTQCEYAGAVDPSRARGYIAQIRAELAKRKEDA